MRELTETQKAYIAGIIDCRGYLGIIHNKRDDYYVKFELVKSDQILIEYLIEITEIGSCSCRKTQISNINKWRLSKLEIKSLLLEIEDFLIVKRKQAELVLKFLEGHEAVKNKKYSSQERELHKSLYEEVRKLDKRS